MPAEASLAGGGGDLRFAIPARGARSNCVNLGPAKTVTGPVGLKDGAPDDEVRARDGNRDRVTGRLTDQLLLAPPLLSDVSQLMKVGAFELILCVAER